MNISKINSFRIVLVALCLVLAVVVATPKVYAQDDDGSGGCDCDGSSYDYAGSSVDDSPSYDYQGSSVDEAPSYDYQGSTVDDTPSYDYQGSSIDDSPSYDYQGSSIDGAPSYDYLGSSIDSATPTYSYTTPTYTSTPSYSSGSGYSSTPTYSVTNPSYSTGVYTTPGVGYSTGIYTTPATGFTSTPIYAPTPVNHTTTPTPVVYATPAPVQQQQQQQQQTATTPAGQPITINNINTNTNTNPNTNTLVNTAPVAPAAPQTIVDYVYPQTITPVSCSISANPNTVGNGAPTILSWTSYGATSAVLSDGIGSVPTNGTIAARPNASIDYVLTVYGVSGTTATCNVTVNVGGGYPSVSLTQIPYTGFDFGPIGDSIYWAALLAFALASAYLLVYYRGGAFTLATAMITGRSNSSIKPVNFTEAETPAAAPIEAPAIEKEAPVAVNARLASVISPIQNLPTAEVRRMTSDAMIVSHSKNGGAPRIVITRG